jgi:hypothetical protein
MSQAACEKLRRCANLAAMETENIKDRLLTAGDITQTAADPVIAIVEECAAKLKAAREMIPLT